MTRARAWVVAVLSLVCMLPRAHAERPPSARYAVVVGANAAAPGRKPLRFAEQDARAVASVLTELGGFRERDVSVLLDPEPAEVLTALDRALARARESDDALVLFYYSGHADASALYPRGRALALSELHGRFADGRASLRLGIIDACRGGGWTGAKGLVEVAPFEVSLPRVVESEGSVLIASSSGLEDAHESELLGGSFFTHHWNAGLRGAGDRNADGQVTLAEAFDYAKALTIRDSALHTSAPQHPSFSLNLRGRQDLALSTVAAASAVVAVDQREGPLELVHLGSGVVLLELPKGTRSLKVAVAPGEYLLRRRQGGEIWTRELSVRAGETTHVSEAALVLSGTGALAIKRSEPRPITRSTLPRGAQEATFWLGVSHQDRPSSQGISLGREFEANAFMPRGLTDRLQWILPTLAFAYRLGEHGGLEWIVSGGVPGWQVGANRHEGFMLTLGLAATSELRAWLSPRTALTFGLLARSKLRWQSRDDPGPGGRLDSPDTWFASVSAGISYTLADSVTLQLATAVGRNVLFRGAVPPLDPSLERVGMTLGVGAVQLVGMRPQHLIQVHLSDVIALNFDAGLQYRFSTRRITETYLFGASFVW